MALKWLLTAMILQPNNLSHFRLVCTPRRMRFFIQPMNLVDLFAILPYFINFIVDHLSEFHIIGKEGKGETRLGSICIEFDLH